jgi:antagonist of KipI
MNVLVERAGFLTTVQDTGRRGHRQSGVSLGGALDAHALRVANLLVGNADAAAGLETTIGTLRLRFEDERAVAWCGGAWEVRIGSLFVPAGHPAFMEPGQQLIMNAPAAGGRAWLAISGGLAVPDVLGSRATDLRVGFGGFNGRALRDGDEIPLGSQPHSAEPIVQKLRPTVVSDWSAPSEWANPRSNRPFLRMVRGADWERFPEEALHAITNEEFRVGPDSDRMGVRLEGPALMRTDPSDLLSEAVVPGTLQVPPNGHPILLLGDCQTIGGYPKIAHVITVDAPAAVQLQPGDPVRFAEVSLGEAQRLLVERERDLTCFRVGLTFRAR